MTLMIAGSHTIDKYDIEPYIPKNTTRILCGDGDGIATIAKRFADDHGIPWGTFSPTSLHPIATRADQILIIWDGVSPNTRRIIDLAKQAQKPLALIFHMKY